MASSRRCFSLILLGAIGWSTSALSQSSEKIPYGGLGAALAGSQATAQIKIGYRLLAQAEAQKAGLPADLVDAVIKVESDYDASRIGSVGEIGLMQVRPATAAMLGFKGAVTELSQPAINIHYGATYLGQAWHLTNGDVCRTLMKYRAGHGEEVMSPLSLLYCARARAHLAAVGSPLASLIAAPALVMQVASAPAKAGGGISTKLAARMPRHGPAFWVAQEARVHAITARLEARWRRVASK